jgi:Virulence protein
MRNKKNSSDNQITIYQTPDGNINIEVLYAHENIWLPQKRMAELFDCTPDNISLHLKNIYKEKELDENTTTEEFSVVQKEGDREVTRTLKCYSLEAIIAVDYSYFATSIDYSPKTEDTKKFFAVVQNKLHFAITGQTAAEIIAQRADNTKPNMGLTSWRKGPQGKILPGDVTVGKNYLEKPELDHLNRIVSMYLDHAELQAVRQRPMYMKDWIEKLNAFLKFSEYEILNNAGSISHEVAQTLAMKEYTVFKKEQDRLFESDFDKYIKQLLEPDQGECNNE